MKHDKLHDALGMIDDEFILQTQKLRDEPKKTSAFVGIAAAVILVCVIFLGVFPAFYNSYFVPDEDATDGATMPTLTENAPEPTIVMYEEPVYGTAPGIDDRTKIYKLTHAFSEQEIAYIMEKITGTWTVTKEAIYYYIGSDLELQDHGEYGAIGRTVTIHENGAVETDLVFRTFLNEKKRSVVKVENPVITLQRVSSEELELSVDTKKLGFETISSEETMIRISISDSKLDYSENEWADLDLIITIDGRVFLDGISKYYLMEKV
ncbi:MAG: hypothetical protein E7491_09200 [Ruminococcaceae bacterium]|nr:hypothetical protein [Oscillospiraceae bacterium]